MFGGEMMDMVFIVMFDDIVVFVDVLIEVGFLIVYMVIGEVVEVLFFVVVNFYCIV